MSITFRLDATDGTARAGLLTTPHGAAPTPAFMPVATQASVKALAPQEVRQVGAAIVLANTYHLYLRPGVERVAQAGGLHRFMRWDGPLLTDSGGFQAYSLGGLRSINEAGVLFKSYLDGTEHLFTPEAVIAYQEALGADIIMPLDQCAPYGEGHAELEEAVERTYGWAVRSQGAHRRADQALFGIVQGGTSERLRREAAQAITALDFPGYAIGGLSVGESKEDTYRMAELTAALLPQDRPRYLMGVGSPEDLVACVARGVDLFDCALPTRVARNGALFTPQGRVNITNARFREMDGPFQEGCDCYACQGFSAAYLHHLFKAQELLAYRLATIHNLRFVLRLMEEMRQAILEGRFEEYAHSFLAAYRAANEEVRVEQRRRWRPKQARQVEQTGFQE
jgi:queuine tRNA-ribosyltransferase